ncbi:MAG: 50S ribosomal protein L6 [Candidatus Harrisonbacteria bacterium]|nr:50S ribosomal protein L6 [Candidatus Harrisonbacteria bacterium]
MSKIGKKPIEIPAGVNIEIKDSRLEIKGKEGALSLSVLPYTKVELKNNQVLVMAEADEKQARSNWGTMRALAQNAVLGVSGGFTKELEIQGIGYRAAAEGANLVLNIGFSHPVKFTPPAGIKISVEKNLIKVSGVDKNLVGEVAAKIRALKKPEPYKGKGIRYKGEVVKIKAGKKAVSTAGAGAAA